MKRFFLMTVLLAGTGLVGLAQSYSTKEQVEEAARAKVQKHVSEILSSMKTSLQGTSKKISLGEMEKAIQFLYDENKLSNLYGGKTNKDSSQLNSVYNKLIKKNKKNANPTVLSYSNPVCGNTETIEGDTKKYYLIVPVSFQALSIADNNASKVKNTVRLEYAVKINVRQVKQTDENGKKVKVPSYEIEDMELKLPTSVKEIEYLDSEIASMKHAAKQAVVDWYAHVQEKLAPKYAVQAIAAVEPVSVSEEEINPIRISRTAFDVKDAKKIKIALDPKKYMDEPAIYYDDPKATLTLTPSFKVIVGDDFETVESIEMTDCEEEIEKPKTIKEKLAMRDKSNKKLNEFAGQLSTYVNTHDSEDKDALMSMFEAADNQVEVSHVTKSGKETIKSRKAEEYVKRLRGLDLTVYEKELIDEAKVNELNEKYPELGLEFDSNLNHVMYLISQKYENKTYKDDTKKIVFMNHQEDGSYTISGIVVVPETTTLE